MGGISIFYFPFDFDRGRLYTIENTILLTPMDKTKTASFLEGFSL